MPGIRRAVKQATRQNLGAAVHRHKAFSRRGLQERMFTLAFRQLVYPQIWEDPVVDLEALAARPRRPRRRHRLGRLQRPVLSDGAAGRDRRRRSQRRAYRAAQPEAARPRRPARPRRLLRLLRPRRPRARISPPIRRCCAPASTRRRAPIGTGAGSTAAGASRRSRAASTATACSAASSAPATRSRGSTASGSTRCSRRARSTSSARSSSARSRRCSTSSFVRWLARRPSALYGLGIPPAQYRALAADGDGRRDRGAEAPRRAARLRLSRSPTITSPGRRSAAPMRRAERAEPAALSAARSISRPCATARRGCGRYHGSFTERLKAEPDASLDAYVLLDAQDWMNDADADRAVARDPPHRAAGRPRHLPHRRRRAAAAGPRARRRCSALSSYEAGARAGARRARPLLDLRRLPPLGAPRERAAAERDGPDVPAPAPHLRPHPQILPARPRRADRRPWRRRRAGRCWKSPAAPAATSSAPPGATRRPGLFGLDVSDEMLATARAQRRVGGPRRPHHARARRRDGVRPASACSASPPSTACSSPTRCR